jgi:hypothetical protein
MALAQKRREKLFLKSLKNEASTYLFLRAGADARRFSVLFFSRASVLGA